MIQFQHFASMIRSENTLGSDKTDLVCEASPRWTAHGVSNAPCATLYRNQIPREGFASEWLVAALVLVTPCS